MANSVQSVISFCKINIYKWQETNNAEIDNATPKNVNAFTNEQPHPSLFVCLTKARSLVTNVICCGLFCVLWFQVRGNCSFFFILVELLTTNVETFFSREEISRVGNLLRCFTFWNFCFISFVSDPFFLGIL